MQLSKIKIKNTGMKEKKLNNGNSLPKTIGFQVNKVSFF